MKVGFLGIFRKLVGFQRAGLLPRPFVESFVAFVRYNSGSFGHVGAQAAGVIEVVVRVDHILDGFVRNDFFHCRNHRKGTRLIQRSVHHGHKILEFDERAIVPAMQQPDAVGKLFRRNALRRDRRVQHRVGHLQRGFLNACLRARHHQIKSGKAALLLENMRGKLHAIEILIIAIGCFNGHISQNRVGNPCLDRRHQVPAVDGANNFIFPEHEGEDGNFRPALVACLRGCMIFCGGFQKAVWGEPDLQAALIRRGRGRPAPSREEGPDTH